MPDIHLSKSPLSKTSFVFALICIFNLIVYWPSLQHVPRSDHIAYLSTVAEQNDWFTLVIENMDLNRLPNLTTGDTWLFRPFLYALLGAERFLFGYSFYLWQLLGVGLHLLFLWSMWKLLSSIREGWMALLFTAMFSVLPVNMDLVIWHHINGYLVALILMFLSVRNCLSFLRQQMTFKKMIIANSLMLLTAALFCEFSLFFTIGLIIYLWRAWPQEVQGKKQIVLLFIPIVVYLVLNVVNWLAIYHSTLSTQGGYAIQGAFLKKGFMSLPSVFFRWFGLGIFPFQFEYYFLDGRFTRNAVNDFNPLTLLNFVLVIKGFLVLIKSPKLLKGDGELKNLLFLFLGLTLALCFIFSVMRVGPRSLSYLKQSLYWAYFYWAFLITAIYILIPREPLTAFPKWSFLSKAFAVSCLLLTFSYGWMDFGILNKRAMEDRASNQLIATIERSRKNSTNDSLDFKQLMNDPGNRRYRYFGKKSLIELLYPRFLLELPS